MLNTNMAMAVAAVATSSASGAARAKPHIVMHLADDFGWANAGWHRPEGFAEVPISAHPF